MQSTQVTPRAEHRTRGAAGHVAARARARGRPRRRGRARRSARASPPPTTCWPACATRASPSAARGGLYHAHRRLPRHGRRRQCRPRRPRGVVDDLLARTHKRAYWRRRARRPPADRARARPAGHAEAAGHATPTIRDNAHALALGKVVLAARPGQALERYLRRGLKRFTPAHDHRPATRCVTELRARPPHRHRVRARGVRRGLLLHRRAGARRARALPRRGRASRCPAAPSTTSASALAETLRDVVAGFQASADPAKFLIRRRAAT